METLNTQKVGSGAQAFDFLNEEKKAGPGEFVDRGFTQDQMQLLEDTEMVKFTNHLILYFIDFLDD